MPSYRDYRRYGHSRFTAATLSIHPALFYGVIALVAVISGAGAPSS